MSNSDNPKIGKLFQLQVLEALLSKYGEGYETEVEIEIGNPPKAHRFDIVNIEKKIAIECKRYIWTESGNVPSAKMAALNEAAFYLSFLSDYQKYIVMLKNYDKKGKESLAEHYYRINHHLLKDIKVYEFDPTNNEFNQIT